MGLVARCAVFWAEFPHLVGASCFCWIALFIPAAARFGVLGSLLRREVGRGCLDPSRDPGSDGWTADQASWFLFMASFMGRCVIIVDKIRTLRRWLWIVLAEFLSQQALLLSHHYRLKN